MTRITTVENPSGRAAELLTMVEKKLGRKPNMMKTLAHAPAALEMYLNMSGAVSGASLTVKDRERIALLSAEVSTCAYCARAHAAIGKKVGLTDSDIESAKQGKGPDGSSAILQFAQALLSKQGKVSNEDLAKARAAGLTDEQLLDTVAVSALNIFTNYVNHVAEPEIDF